METIIDVKNLSFKYNEIIVFDDLNLQIFHQNTSIIGSGSSGKTTFAKIMSGIYLDEAVTIFDLKLNKKNINEIRKKLMVVNNEYNFLAETVADEIAFGMENLKYSNQKMDEAIYELANYFNLAKKLPFDPSSLSKSDQTLIKIISYVAMDPVAMVFDDVLTHLKEEDKNKIFKYLKSKKIKFINITTEIEEVLYGDYLIVLDKGKIIVEGKTSSVLGEEKILKRFGFNLPFSVDLSRQLQAYGLLNKTYYNIDKIVEELWK